MCRGGERCPLLSGTFLARHLTELPAHILEEDHHACLPGMLGGAEGGTHSKPSPGWELTHCTHSPCPGAAPCHPGPQGPVDGSMRRAGSEIRPSCGSGLPSVVMRLGQPLTPRNLASQAGTHPQQEGEILSDIKGPARSNRIFDKWRLCQWGSSFTY